MLYGLQCGSYIGFGLCFFIIVLCYSIIYVYDIDSMDLGLMGFKICNITYILSFSKPIIVRDKHYKTNILNP